MAKFKCNQCGKESNIPANVSACPFCDSQLSDETLATMTESADIAASFDTSIPQATIKHHSKAAADSDEPSSPGDSSKTVMAADLGYAESPAFMKTLDKTGTTREPKPGSAGRSSSIPSRTIGDEQSGDEIRDYRLEQEIGQGSFGTVFRALQVPLDRHVALKLLKPLPLPANTEGDQSKVAREQAETKVRDEFLREAQFTGKLEHPNIVPIHDIGIVSGGKQSDRPFYVMKEIKGISWQDVIGEKTRDENVDIFQRVVDGIGFAHSRNILHCDLKPENVMLGEFGEVLVVDWGQAIETSRPETFRPGGTPSYCSPEMAQYWCDFGQNPKQAEKSKRDLGPASDVYLLGAILFQIVTGKPPHYGLKGENAADVMARAARNDIRRYDNFSKDELLQIALRALRLSQQPPITTVAQLNVELKSYEARKQSIDLRDRAFDMLAAASLSKDHETYQKAKFGFEESLELWKENPTAQDGLQQTRLGCAELALVDQNFDLGLGMLDEADTPAEIKLKDKLLVGKKRRDRRKKMVALLSVGFAAAVLIGMVATTYLGNRAINERSAANTAKETAREAQAEADQARTNAETEKIQANEAISALEVTVKESQTQLTNVETQKSQAEAAAITATELADEKTKAANEAIQKEAEATQRTSELEVTVQSLEIDKRQAESAKNAAVQQEQLARQAARSAEESSRLLLYKTQITNVTQKANAQDFNSTRRLLDAQPDDNKRTVEWARLNLLAHPEVTDVSRFPAEPLIEAQLSGDKETLALCFTNRIEICRASDPKKVLNEIKMSGVQAIALSHDGKSLAIAKLGDTLQPGGTIAIVDTTHGRELLPEPLSAQSARITDLEFSQNGQRLMSVGIPSRPRRSVNLEHPLMLWQVTGDGWQPLPFPKFRGKPALLSQANFSADGNRIVTSNPDGRPQDRYAFVLELSGDTYQWIGPSDVDSTPRRPLKSGFITSIFADPQGSQVVSSFVVESGDRDVANQIVVWDVAETEQTTPVSLQPNALTNWSVDRYPVFRSEQAAIVDARINYLDYNGEILLATQEKQMIYWALPTNDLTRLPPKPTNVFGGHGHAIGFSKILNAGSKFMTIATGSEPEILLTNTMDFRKTVESLQLTNDSANVDIGTPISYYLDASTDRTMIGNDEGLVSINHLANVETDGKPLLKWHTAAWEKHIVTREKLFALSKRDDLYRYDLDTGDLEIILTQLSEINADSFTEVETKQRILTLDISADGRFAVLQRQNEKSEFEIWNLQNQTRKIVSYGNKQGLDGNQILPALTISDDGQWIAGGRIRFYVWRNDGTDVGFAGIENSSKKPLNCLKFFAGSSQLAVGHKGLLRVYDVEPQLSLQHSYPISGQSNDLGQPNIVLSDNLGVPNIVAAQRIDGKSYVVIDAVDDNQAASTKSTLALLELLDEGQFKTVATFAGAQQATLSSAGKLLAVSRDQTQPLIEFDLKTNQQKNSLLTVSPRAVAGKNTEERKIFNRIYITPEQQRVLQWTVNGRQNTVVVNDEGTISGLCVVANPTIQTVGLSKNRAATFDNGKVRFWDLDFENSAVSPAGSVSENVGLFLLAPGGDQAFAVIGSQQKIGLIDFASGKVVKELDVDLPSTITAADWSADGSQLALGFADGTTGLLLLADESFKPIPWTANHTPIEDLKFSADSQSIVVVPHASTAEPAVPERAAYVLKLNAASNAVDDEDAVIGSATQAWKSVRLAYADNDAIISADISRDGKRVVTGSSRGRVTIWNSEIQAGSSTDRDSSDRDSSDRELLNLERFETDVRTVRFGKQESSVIAFEENEHEGRIFPVLQVQ